EPTETETDSGGPTAPTTSSPDAGSETGGVDAGTTVEAGDSGSTEATDAGTTPSGDAATESDAATSTPTESDGATSISEGTDAGADAGEDACVAACATAAKKNCGDTSTCEADLCGIRQPAPDCIAEADAYLRCVAESDPDADFTCSDNKASFTGQGCLDPYQNDWAACFAAHAM
ncbi:MAG TPA: hypothetical protein VHM70_04525, partial [Polyangiaceae bacterium]|nr:hypothetical protein [Polyangiaceae bacterium]